MMWLDRFSTSSTPVPSISTDSSLLSLPRRSFLSQRSSPSPRPPLDPRNSTLSVIPSVSTTRSSPDKNTQTIFAFGSVLVSDAAASANDDALKALESTTQTSIKISHVRDVSETSQVALYNPVARLSTLDDDIDFKGLSLLDYMKDGTDDNEAKQRIALGSDQSVERYETQRERFVDLHKSIRECDDILKSVETYLAGFQKDLSTVSAEIETLQSRSSTMNSKLENRQNVERLLGPVVEQITFAPALVRKLNEGSIDDHYTKALEELNNRLKLIASDSEGTKIIRGFADLRPVLEQLSDRSVERIRDHFVSQIKALRTPNANAQTIQRQGFLRFKPLFTFLTERQPQLGEELCQAYVNTMRWYYTTHFTRYETSLRKLNIPVTTRHDVLGEDANSTARATSAAAKSNAARAHDPFNISRRIDILSRPLVTALPSHAAESTASPQNLETPFLSFNLALLDNASFEYTFLTTFFLFSHHALSRHHTTMFTPIYNLGYALTRTLTSESFDALGVLLSLRLTSRLAFILQRRKIPVLDGYINATNMLLWPRFQQILDANCDSLRRLTAMLPNRAVGASAAASAFATLSGGTAAAATQSTAPHPVTQRFANFLASVLALSAVGAGADAGAGAGPPDVPDATDGLSGDDGPVATSVSRLRADFEAFLAKAAAGFGPGEKARRERDRFLANNYSLVLTVIADTRGKLAAEQTEHFESLRGTLAGKGRDGEQR